MKTKDRKFATKSSYNLPTTQLWYLLLDGIQARVVAVNVDGLVRTKNDIVMESVKDLFQVKLVTLLRKFTL